MKQTLESALRPITAQANLEKEQAKTNSDPTAKAPEKSFHEKEREKQKNDPDNFAYTEAKKLGAEKAKAFLASAANIDDKNHKMNVGIFKDKYQMDARKVLADFEDQACHQLGSLPYEIGDPNYVRNLKLKFKPTGNVSPEIQKNYDNFCESIDRKHFARGYKNDLNFVNEMSDMYGLKANDQIQSLRDIQIKN